jgi:hypothetical protein
MDDPFVFVEGLNYYDALYKLCQQLGLDSPQRRLVEAQSGKFLDAVPDKSGQLFYSAAP